jgi:hypothetical protein
MCGFGSADRRRLGGPGGGAAEGDGVRWWTTVRWTVRRGRDVLAARGGATLFRPAATGGLGRARARARGRWGVQWGGYRGSLVGGRVWFWYWMPAWGQFVKCLSYPVTYLYLLGSWICYAL